MSASLGSGPESLVGFETTILQAIAQSPDGKASCLILDGLDFLLAATGCAVDDLLDVIYEIRTKVGRLVITTRADASLLHSHQTPLEIAHAAFTMSVTHQARVVMSLRELDTGAAKDISGVLRITRGGEDTEDGGKMQGLEEREYLYHVGADGSARVFDRGS